MANPSYDDKEFVARLRAGDLQALNHLIDRYKDLKKMLAELQLDQER